MKRVIKLGGRAQSSPELAPAIAREWAAHPSTFCLVHGGGDRISQFQRSIGIEPSFVGGRRVTTREDIEAVRMVLSGLVNKELVSSLVALGVAAVGISGEDAGLIRAATIEELGRVGAPTRVDAKIIDALLDQAFLPVISPLATDENTSQGEPLNVNGDDAAAAIAVALGADELILIADVSGVLNDNGATIATLDEARTAELIDRGTINKGMRAKLEAGFTALARGVTRVRITPLEGIQNPDSGTSLKLAQSLTT